MVWRLWGRAARWMGHGGDDGVRGGSGCEGGMGMMVVWCWLRWGDGCGGKGSGGEMVTMAWWCEGGVEVAAVEWGRRGGAWRRVSPIYTPRKALGYSMLFLGPKSHKVLGLAVSVFSPRDDPIACLNKAMAFLTVVASSRVTVQKVQGRQGQSYSGTGYKSNATSSGGNNASGQTRVVKCYNCQGEGHMARQCTDISKIIRNPPKHGHEKWKSTREAKDSNPKPKKVNSQSTMGQQSQLTRRQNPKM
ncbi:integrase, catalytic region, zinc finger, CCHC-type containing protein, partial [Tanacetum coccineum]